MCVAQLCTKLFMRDLFRILWHNRKSEIIAFFLGIGLLALLVIYGISQPNVDTDRLPEDREVIRNSTQIDENLRKLKQVANSVDTLPAHVETFGAKPEFTKCFVDSGALNQPSMHYSWQVRGKKAVEFLDTIRNDLNNAGWHIDPFDEHHNAGAHFTSPEGWTATGALDSWQEGAIVLWARVDNDKPCRLPERFAK